MSDALAPARRQPTDWKTQAMQRRIRRRYAAERRFRLMGLAAIVISAGFLVFLLVTMLGGGLRGFPRTAIALQIDYPKTALTSHPAVVAEGGEDRKSGVQGKSVSVGS